MLKTPVLDKNKPDPESIKPYNKVLIISFVIEIFPMIMYKNWDKNLLTGKSKSNVYNQLPHVNI